jgi:hypothetical protein
VTDTIRPDRIRSAARIGFPLPTDPPTHSPDFSTRHESGLPLCVGCRQPVTAEQWTREPCPGREERTMRQPITEQHHVDEHGNPAGGTTSGRGISIEWQNGPLAVDGVRREPNGAFVEGVIAAALGRLQHYQASRFKCRENALAITKLEEALHWLESRTKDREQRGVEGTHQV